jgi:hypothetical protein
MFATPDRARGLYAADQIIAMAQDLSVRGFPGEAIAFALIAAQAGEDAGLT